MRVVSLLPSATEILDAVGAIDLLVARSHECDSPNSVGALPVLTDQRTRFTSSSAVDEAVRTRVRPQGAGSQSSASENPSEGSEADRSLYDLDGRLLAELRPDLILTQDLCDVCSVDLRTVERLVAAMPEPRPRILSLNPHSVEDVLDDHLRVGEAVGRPDRARRAVVEFRERLHRAQEFVNEFEQGPVVGFMEWTDPVFIAGHWTVQMIERAGGRHPLNETVAKESSGAAAGLQQGARVAGKSVRVPTEAFAAVQPERLIVCPCGLSLDQIEREYELMLEHAWFRELPAVRSGRVALVDGSQMFNRPGPRLVDAFEWLVGWLQERPELIPDRFPWARPAPPRG